MTNHKARFLKNGFKWNLQDSISVKDFFYIRVPNGRVSIHFCTFEELRQPAAQAEPNAGRFLAGPCEISVHDDSRNTHDAIPTSHQRNRRPQPTRNLPVHKKVFHLFGPRHARRFSGGHPDETTEGPGGTSTPRHSPSTLGMPPRPKRGRGLPPRDRIGFPGRNAVHILLSQFERDWKTVSPCRVLWNHRRPRRKRPFGKSK